jgi:hypothetical protein
MLLAVVIPLGAWVVVARALPMSDVVGAAVAFAVGSFAIIAGMRAAPMAWLAQRPQVVLAPIVGVGLSLASLKLPAVPSHLAGSFGLILAGAALGGAVGTRMLRAGHILPVALVSAGVDLWSVTSPHGPTHAIVRNPALVRLLTVSVALPSSPEPQPAIGVGDVIFVAIYLSAAQRFSLPIGRTLALLGAGVVTAGALAMVAGAPVPALPFIGFAVVLGHRAARAVHPEDRAATALAALLFVSSVLRVAMRWEQIRAGL